MRRYKLPTTINYQIQTESRTFRKIHNEEILIDDDRENNRIMLTI